jgi:hypothetical protein
VADDDGIEILVLEQFAEVVVRGHTLVIAGLGAVLVAFLDHLLRAIETFLDDIAHRDDFHFLPAEQAAEVAAAHRADADKAERKAVARLNSG